MAERGLVLDVAGTQQAGQAAVVGTPPSEVIAPREAAVVCHCLGLSEGCSGGDFTAALVALMMVADWADLARLALGFPGFAAAVRLAKGDEGAVARLVGIAERARDRAESGGCRCRDAIGSVVHDSHRYQGLALRRIHAGAITKVAGVYLDNGEPTPDELTGALDELSWATWVSVPAAGNPLWDERPVSLTDTGAARYAALSPREQAPGQHRAALAVPDPVFGSQTPVERPPARG